MAKLIITLGGSPLIQGFKRGEFVWQEKYKCYTWKDREFDDKEFNAEAEKVFNQFYHLRPGVKVVADEKPVESPQNRKEITLEEAEAVLRKLAPDRLKKKPGRKPGLATA